MSSLPAPNAAAPLVSLGVPVYNGGAQLEAAIGSLQAQTWPSLEILISDNASTDATETICRRLAREDARIRYVRQATNLGAARNFDFVAREARGAFFAWCAHDDLRLPGYVAACAAELTRRPEAVLCNSAVAFLDERGRVRLDWKDSNFATRDMNRPERALRLIDHLGWVDIYGLVRRDALLKVLPFDPVWGMDVVLSMKLLMLGDFAKVGETLFHYRVRTRPKSPAKIMREIGQRTDVLSHPYTDMVQALFRVVIEAAAGRLERADALWRFLRTMMEVAPAGPQSSWRSVLMEEHRGALGPDPAWETFPRHLLGWLSESLPVPAELRGKEAIALAFEGVRRVLVAIAGDQEDAERALALLRALRKRLPRAEVALLCPEAWVPRMGSLPGVSTVLPFSPLPDQVAALDRDEDPELTRNRGWGADLVFCASRRRGRRLDRLASRSGLLGFAFVQPAIAVGRWYSRRQVYDPNRRWGFLLPRDGKPEDLLIPAAVATDS